MKRATAIAAMAMVLIPVGTSGEPDTFGLGTGRAVPPNLVVPASTSLVVNTYAGVTAQLSAGDFAIPVSTIAGFLQSDLVMVLQTTGIAPEPSSGQPGPFDISNDPVGRWELARLASVNAVKVQLQLTAPLIYSYPMNVTQVIRVPEYQSVMISTGASVIPAPWDGSTGGVVAFLVQGNINIASNGQINANGAGAISAGFRGGQAIVDARLRDAGICAALDEAPADGGQKGEGIASTRYAGPTGSGRGNLANGAGGGDCFNAGGGGGGNGGAGGNGGFSWIGDGSRNVGGLGGGALNFSALTRLALGGGGGAGHETGGPGSSGGRGGGIIFIRASRMVGTGIVTANGQSASSGGIDDGAGGGGAGGTVYLRFVDGGVVCNSVTANGGDGGSTAGGRGPGGGGGGGHLLIQGANLTGCPTFALPGMAGSQADGGAYGADAGLAVPVEVPPGPFRPTLSQPTIIAPADGSSTSNPRPPISGSGADANVTVIVLLDGSELVRISSDPTGNFSFTPVTDLSLGPHQVQAAGEFQAVQSPPSLPSSFTIIVADGGAGDAGNLDGGPGDAGPSDGGPDAGNPDAGNIDGGSGLDFIGGGCNCQSVGGGVLVPVLLISALVAIRRNKRRPSQ